MADVIQPMVLQGANRLGLNWLDNRLNITPQKYFSAVNAR